MTHGPLSKAPPRFLRVRLAIGFLLIAAVVYLSLTPHPIELPTKQGDKYGHILAYAALMFWFALIYRAIRERAWLFLAFVLLGVVLEFLQGLTDYRRFEVVDMLADAGGVFAGWIAVPPYPFRRTRAGSAPAS